MHSAGVIKMAIRQIDQRKQRRHQFRRLHPLRGGLPYRFDSSPVISGLRPWILSSSGDAVDSLRQTTRDIHRVVAVIRTGRPVVLVVMRHHFHRSLSTNHHPMLGRGNGTAGQSWGRDGGCHKHMFRRGLWGTVVVSTHKTTVIITCSVRPLNLRIIELIRGCAAIGSSYPMMDLACAFGYFIYMGMLRVFSMNAINIVADTNRLYAQHGVVIILFEIMLSMVNLQSSSNAMGNVALLRAHHVFSLDILVPLLSVALKMLPYNW